MSAPVPYDEIAQIHDSDIPKNENEAKNFFWLTGFLKLPFLPQFNFG